MYGSTVCRYTIRKSRMQSALSCVRSREEFLAHIVLPNGKGTVGDWLMPQIDKAYESGTITRMLMQQALVTRT
jgi:hypothetical protein